MNNLERQLQKIPTAKPSGNLKRLIFDCVYRTGDSQSMFRRHIPLWWAAALACFIGLAGYIAATLHRASADQKSVPVVQIVPEKHIVTSDFSLFDYSDMPSDSLIGDGELVAWVQVSEPTEEN